MASMAAVGDEPWSLLLQDARPATKQSAKSTFFIIDYFNLSTKNNFIFLFYHRFLYSNKLKGLISGIPYKKGAPFGAPV